MSGYRIFISYSHADEPLVLKIEAILRANGFTPMRDRQFAYGSGFHEQIKLFISHAHVFLPILTKTSSERGWVHQEIGYAMALNIPMLPIAVGRFPGEMLQTLHALSLTEEEAAGDLKHITEDLSQTRVANLVNRFADAAMATHIVAEFALDRSQMLTEYADLVLKLQVHGFLRQRGVLGNFATPTEVITNPIWRERYGNGSFEKQLFNNRLNRAERVALEQHARNAGCRLIINPFFEFARYGRSARICRLNTLRTFLVSMTDDKLEIAFCDPKLDVNSITIVGDWFIAEAVSGSLGEGYRQTNFSRHAPSMQAKIDTFDHEFHERLECWGWTAHESRSKALAEIDKILAKLREEERQTTG